MCPNYKAVKAWLGICVDNLTNIMGSQQRRLLKSREKEATPNPFNVIEVTYINIGRSVFRVYNFSCKAEGKSPIRTRNREGLKMSDYYLDKAALCLYRKGLFEADPGELAAWAEHLAQVIEGEKDALLRQKLAHQGVLVDRSGAVVAHTVSPRVRGKLANNWGKYYLTWKVSKSLGKLPKIRQSAEEFCYNCETKIVHITFKELTAPLVSKAQGPSYYRQAIRQSKVPKES